MGEVGEGHIQIN